MSRYSLDNIGEVVSGTEFRTGVITSVYYEEDRADVDVNGLVYEKVPIFYKCGENHELQEDFRVKNSAEAFINEDEVVVCFISGQPLIIGFVGGAQPCFQSRIAYRSGDSWFVAKEGEVAPTILLSISEFEKQYSLSEPLENSGNYSLVSSKHQLDSCYSITTHSLSFEEELLLEYEEHHDRCLIDMWGGQLFLHNQGSFKELNACFYEYANTTIINSNTWTVDRYYRFGFEDNFMEVAYFHEYWSRNPPFTGEKIRKINPMYGGKNKENEFILTSCVVGTDEKDKRLVVYLYSTKGLTKNEFLIENGNVDFGIGLGEAEAFIVKLKRGRKDDLAEA